MAEGPGRPTVMNENTLRILEDAFSNGASDIEACFLANISTESLYAYQRYNPEYSARKEALKEMIKYQARKKIKEAIIGEDKPDTAKWYLERKDKDFKSKFETDVNLKELPKAIKIETDGNIDDKTNHKATAGLEQA